MSKGIKYIGLDDSKDAIDVARRRARPLANAVPEQECSGHPGQAWCHLRMVLRYECKQSQHDGRKSLSSIVVSGKN